MRNYLSSHFLIAFKQDADIQWERAVGGEQGFEGLDLRPYLPLVVSRSPCVEIAVALGGLEGGREPLVEGIGRLHIVVTIDEHCWLSGGVQPIGIDQRMAFALNQAPILQADALQFGEQRFGGLAAIVLVRGIRGDGRNAQQGLQFIEKTRVVLAGKCNGGRRHELLPSRIRQMRV